MTILETVLILVVSILVITNVWFICGEIHYRKEFVTAKTEQYRWKRKYEEEEQEHQAWLGAFDRHVEVAVEKRIRSWEPKLEDAEAEFKRAEFMAKNRRVRDAGRLHPARDDGGEPARISRISMRSTTPRPADPK